MLTLRHELRLPVRTNAEETDPIIGRTGGHPSAPRINRDRNHLVGMRLIRHSRESLFTLQRQIPDGQLTFLSATSSDREDSPLLIPTHHANRKTGFHRDRCTGSAAWNVNNEVLHVL